MPALGRWRWRDSNPRPNIIPDSFLHAYSSFGVGYGMPEDGLCRSLSFFSWRGLKESPRASGLDDTPYARKDRPESWRDIRQCRSLGGSD